MATTTAEEFLAVLEKSRILTPEQLVTARRVAEENSDPTATARAMVRQSLLTRWQAGQLLAGRSSFFLGKYKLIDLLGRGGMGSVFLGEHVTMNRRVALKIVSKQVGKDPASLKRFLAEARAIAALDHPNIVQAYSVDNERERYYIVMEYVDGRDLLRIVEDEGPLDYKRAADYIRQAADGLAHAHEQNLIHCDIKPSNLIVNSQGVVKILDLGLTRLVDSEESANGEDEKVLGSVDYQAPEQALKSPDFDHRADIYSLGCTLYFLLTGHPPFPEGTLHERIVRHQTQEPRSILEARPDAPSDLVAICRTMMAKNPDDRPQMAAEVSRLLAGWRPPVRKPKRVVPLKKAESLDGSAGQVIPTVQVSTEPKPGGKAPANGRSARPQASGLAALLSTPRQKTVAVVIAALALVVAGVVLGTVIPLLISKSRERVEKETAQAAASPDSRRPEQAAVLEPRRKPKGDGSVIDLSQSSGENPPAEAPPAEKPPAETPPAEKPPAETPPAESPPAEAPPAEKPPAETPPAEKPPAEKPPAEKPPFEGLLFDVPSGEKPAAEKPPTEKPPTEKPPVKKPSVEKPMPAPPEKKDPFPELAAAVDLPPFPQAGADAQANAPTSMGKLPVGPDAAWKLELLGGQPEGSKVGRQFVLQDEGQGKAWRVRLLTDAKGANPAQQVDLARVWLNDQTLQFQWLEGAAAQATQVQAKHLRNCGLLVHVGDQSRCLALAKPHEMEPLAVDLSRGVAKATLPPELAPSPAALRLQVLDLSGPFPKAEFKPTDRTTDDKGQLLVTFSGAKLPKLGLKVSLITKGRARVESTLMYQLADSPEAVFRAGDAQRVLDAATIRHKMLSNTLDKVPENQKAGFKKQLDTLTLMIEQLQGMAGLCKELGSDGKILYRVFATVDGHEIDLCRTSSAGKAPEGKANGKLDINLGDPDAPDQRRKKKTP